MRKIMLCLLLILCGCQHQNEKIDDPQDTKDISNDENIQLNATSSDSDIENQNDEKSETSLEDCIKNDFDQQTLDLFNDIRRYEYDELTFELSIGNRKKAETIADPEKISDFFKLFDIAEPISFNQYFPDYYNQDKKIHADVKLLTQDNEEINCRLAIGLNNPSFIMCDASNTEYFISFSNEFQKTFENYFDFINLGVSLKGPGEVGAYENQFAEASANTPYLINQDEVYPQLNIGGDLIIDNKFTFDETDPLRKALSSVFITGSFNGTFHDIGEAYQFIMLNYPTIPITSNCYEKDGETIVMDWGYSLSDQTRIMPGDEFRAHLKEVTAQTFTEGEMRLAGYIEKYDCYEIPHDNVFRYENWQILVTQQSVENDFIFVDALAFYTEPIMLNDQPRILIYDQNWKPLKRSEFNYYEGISYGEALLANQDRFTHWTFKLKQKEDGELIMVEAAHDAADTKSGLLDPALPIVNVYQSNGLYEGKYTYPSNYQQAMPQFNLSGYSAYLINHQIQMMRGTINGYIIDEDEAKIEVKAIRRDLKGYDNGSEFVYYPAAVFIYDKANGQLTSDLDLEAMRIVEVLQ